MGVYQICFLAVYWLGAGYEGPAQAVAQPRCEVARVSPARLDEWLVEAAERLGADETPLVSIKRKR